MYYKCMDINGWIDHKGKLIKKSMYKNTFSLEKSQYY